MADESPREGFAPIHVYIDEEIDADSIEDLRAKAADLAEEAWRREVAFRAELAARPPSEPHDPMVSSEAVRSWGHRLLDEVNRPWPWPGGNG